ncbi:hypothetical protein MK372_09465, partial [Streptococcus oralis]
GTD